MPFTDKTAEDEGKGFQILGAKKYGEQSNQPGGESISGNIGQNSGAVQGAGDQPMAQE